MKIHTLDLLYQNRINAIASYLVEGPAGAVLVETGPGSTLPNLKAGLAQHGYAPEDIRHVLVTHIHLDHAGCAGWWAQQGAQVYIHHVGAPHLINPEKLIASATRIYGEQMDALWGEILPAPAEQVTAVYDGDKIEVCGLTFTALDTPGHAYHHHTWRLEDIAFTGDAAGINLPTIDFVDLPAPPPEFHLETWQATIQRLSKEPLEAIYPTHFGRLEAWQSQLTRLSALMEEAVEVVRRELDGGADRETLLATYQAWYRARAEERQVPEAVFDRYVTANPPYMSVDGIARYWRKKEKQAASKG